MPDRNQAVAALVLEHSECARVFQRHRIDFCCRGELSIEAAAQERGVELDALLGELASAITERGADSEADPRKLSTPGLVAHIVSTHHEYLRHALPFVKGLALKVGRVHGAHNPGLRELAQTVVELSETLLPHLDEEERALFPALTAQEPDPAELKKMFEGMLAEHLVVAKLLEQIRLASEDFTLPDWACNSYRTLFSELRQLESDIFTHVHLENHVLKPRFSTLAA